MPIGDIALSLAALPCTIAGTYLGLLAVYSRRPSAAHQVSDDSESPLRFEIVIPAHDEASVIGAAIQSVLALEYPEACKRVTVVADNCGDQTATIARSAGVRVLERIDATARGKGHALAMAFAACLRDEFADVVVVVDADSVVSANLLTAFAARINAGAQVVQASYRVRNPDLGRRTRLMSLAFALFHDVRSLARERLGVSCGLRGNGMGFSRAALMRVPYQAVSVVEDLEYGIELALAGVRVGYVPEAAVFGDAAQAAANARTQRIRWEGGRAQIARRYRRVLLEAAWRTRSLTLLDLAADLLVPPLATLVTLTTVGASTSMFARWIGWTHTPMPLVLWAIATAGLVGYVARGCALAERGPRILLDLAWAPFYIAWKLPLQLFTPRYQRAEWIRTGREAKK